jgi:hypothetical protein
MTRQLIVHQTVRQPRFGNGLAIGMSIAVHTPVVDSSAARFPAE